MDLLGAPVALKGFTAYAGGLDTTRDLNGQTSYYTEWKGYEVMFHVAPLLVPAGSTTESASDSDDRTPRPH